MKLWDFELSMRWVLGSILSGANEKEDWSARGAENVWCEIGFEMRDLRTKRKRDERILGRVEVVDKLLVKIILFLMRLSVIPPHANHR